MAYGGSGVSDHKDVRAGGVFFKSIALKPWSVVLFDEIMPTILEKVDFECLFSKRGCHKK